METDPIPHVIIDVRNPEKVSFNPVPEDLKAAVQIPGEDPSQTVLTINKESDHGNAPSLHCPAYCCK